MAEMPKIWLVKEGVEPTQGSGAQLSWADCVEKLGLRNEDYHCGLDDPPKFEKCDLGLVTGPKFVIVEISDKAATNTWKPGFYLLKKSVIDALKVLPKAVTDELTNVHDE